MIAGSLGRKTCRLIRKGQTRRSGLISARHGAWAKDARRRMCLNCEYFCTSPMMQAMMEAIPVTDYDSAGGGRGYCKKFDFQRSLQLRRLPGVEEDD